MNGKPVMTSELNLIRELYPQGGAIACMKVIDRSRTAINMIAMRNGITMEREAFSQMTSDFMSELNRKRRL